MEVLELVRSGIELVDTLVAYLAKDAVGSEFLGAYLGKNFEQKQAAEKQRATLQELVASSSEMEQATGQIAQRAEKNIERLSEIYTAIASLRDSVARIEAEYRKYTEQFKVVKSRTDEIKKQIDDIVNISERTNLLSFNASIEAAHAGSAGAGFRIIANEVKKLSENTRKSSDQILANMEKLIGSITDLEHETMNNADALTGLAEETNGTLETFEKVRKINSANNADVEQVSSAISKNMQGMQAVIQDIQKFEDSNKQNIARFAESASRNEMLFNDFYSFVYEIRAVLQSLQRSLPKTGLPVLEAV